jgi:hypothetical protein
MFMDKNIKDLVLLLLYLTCWEEQTVAESGKIRRSWKGYPWDALNTLEEDEFITQSRRAKSVCLTDDGIKRGEQLKKKFKIKD